jgi:hypothetical protein
MLERRQAIVGCEPKVLESFKPCALCGDVGRTSNVKDDDVVGGIAFADRRSLRILFTAWGTSTVG